MTERDSAAAPDAVPIVGIGASAGGLEALREMLTPARAPTGMAFVVVQHLDPNHESMLAQLLDRHTNLEVRQCEGSEQIHADHVYIIPPGRGLAIRGGVLELTDFVQPRGLRRPIDDFFLSLANDQQGNAACVILSGTGADGTTGLRAIKENGGVSVVQRPESARYDGMPLSAVGTGLVDFVKPAGEIVACLQAFFARRTGEPKHEEAEVVADHIDDLCRVLRNAVGHDFSGYKRTTLVRRVERRMHVLGIGTGSAYLARVKGDANECEALFRDLLINVTRFFRDAELFETLRTKAILPLIRDRDPDEDIRIWVPGCSSGEEAYSIAMLFADAAREAGEPLAVQVFATDIDEQMLQIAREGSYPVAALADIPAPLRERYTMPHAERFSISNEIRDMIRFSNHSLVKDPPFSRIDLVSCRNLLIYFDDRLQQSVLPLLHYAVRPGGFLFLGPSESVGRFDHLFPAVDSQARLFERSPGSPTYPIDLPGGHDNRGVRRRDERTGRDSGAPTGDDSAAMRRIVDRYAPPSMVLDQDGGILAAFGKLSRYFNFPVTRAGGSSAVTLARSGLREVIGPMLRQARDTRKRVVARDVAVTTEYGIQKVEVICDPMADRSLLFLFRDSAPFAPVEYSDLADLEPGDDHIEALEDELRLTRHRLRSTVEELETANEELKSSNEEMMSMNEELQSTNEELSTVNDELKTKVDQLTVANSDLRNFFESTDLAVVVLDDDLRIRSFTEAARSIFPLQPGDRGRPLTDVATRLATNEYLEGAAAVAAGGLPQRHRVTTRDGERTLALRILPYRTQGNGVDGATLVLTDITEALSMERALAAERERLDIAVKAGGIGVWEYRAATNETLLDDTGRRLFGVDADEAHSVRRLFGRIVPADRRRVRRTLADAIAAQGDFEMTFRVAVEDKERWIKGFGRVVTAAPPHRMVGVSIDVTAEHAIAETRELMLREMNHRVKNLFAIISGIVSAAARSHADVREMAEDVRERIATLGRAHSLASPAGEQQAIELGTLVEATIAPYLGQARTRVDGPRLLIDRRFLSPLALILHEWATNSVKYGALSHGEGALAVEWSVEGDRIRLLWSEIGGQPPADIPSKGFGTTLVQTSSRQLDAQLERQFTDERFLLTLILPDAILSHD
ncbi:CheR family methyltransferase [Sphingomonadaceae bacterium jetA1]|uniref:chemotaxis protein CheB n=1 Tax=Facivitalis istanbulensis TaxID=3075838 RepID=UPI00348EF57C